MQLFDAVEIINDTRNFIKGERGHIVKVVDVDNALIYLYRWCVGKIEGIVNKSNLKILPSYDYEHRKTFGCF